METNTRDYVRRNGGIHRRTIPSEATVKPLCAGQSVRLGNEDGVVKVPASRGVVGVSFDNGPTVYVSAGELEPVETSAVLGLQGEVRTLTEELEKASDRESDLHQAFYKLEEQLRDALEQLEATRNSFDNVCTAVAALGRKFNG